jgi:phage FluMu protein Com
MAIQLQCHSCQKVLQVADSAAGKKARCPGCQTLIDVPVGDVAVAKATPVSKPVATPEPVKPTASPSQIKVICQSCDKVLQVPVSAAGKAVRCPGCQNAVSVPAVLSSKSSSGATGSAAAGNIAKPSATKPSETPRAPSRPVQTPVVQTPAVQSDFFSAPAAYPVAPAATPIQGTGNALWDEIGDVQNGQAAGGGWAAPAANPYASYSSSYSGSSSKMNRTPFYIITGVFISLWGLLIVAASVIRIAATIYTFANLPPNVTIDYARFSGFVIGMILGFILGMIQLVGGISIATRNSLSTAKTVSIIAAIPCFGGLAFPFGIWAAVLVFSQKAKREFGES